MLPFIRLHTDSTDQEKNKRESKSVSRRRACGLRGESADGEVRSASVLLNRGKKKIQNKKNRTKSTTLCVSRSHVSGAVSVTSWCVLPS